MCVSEREGEIEEEWVSECVSHWLRQWGRGGVSVPEWEGGRDRRRESEWLKDWVRERRGECAWVRVRERLKKWESVIDWDKELDSGRVRADLLIGWFHNHKCPLDFLSSSSSVPLSLLSSSLLLRLILPSSLLFLFLISFSLPFFFLSLRSALV